MGEGKAAEGERPGVLGRLDTGAVGPAPLCILTSLDLHHGIAHRVHIWADGLVIERLDDLRAEVRRYRTLTVAAEHVRALERLFASDGWQQLPAESGNEDDASDVPVLDAPPPPALAAGGKRVHHHGSALPIIENAFRPVNAIAQAVGLTPIVWVDDARIRCRRCGTEMPTYRTRCPLCGWSPTA